MNLTQAGSPGTIHASDVRPVIPVARRKAQGKGNGHEVWHDGRWMPEAEARAAGAYDRPMPTHVMSPITRRQGEPDADALAHVPERYTFGSQPIVKGRANTPKPPGRPGPRPSRALLPEFADRVCPHAHVGQWFRNTKGHPECSACRVEQGRRYREHLKERAR